MDDSEMKNLEMEKLSLIDISSEDEFLVRSPSADGFADFRLSVAFENLNKSDGFEPFGTGISQEVEKEADTFWQKKQEALPSESILPEEISRIGNCCPRKSLAWDSAFFTNAGVLDPEELSILNRGFKKGEVHLLPRIKEDVWRSAESTSYISTSDFALKSLEADLFEDIRASIPNVYSSNKVVIASRNRVKSISANSRQPDYFQGLQRNAKEISIRSRAVQGAARSVECNPWSLKPPKSTTSGANHVKMGKVTSKGASVSSYKNVNISETEQDLMASKKPDLIPRSIHSPKTFPPPSTPPSSRSPLKISRRKAESCTGSPLNTTPLRSSKRIKSELTKSNLANHLLPLSKSPFCTSPTRSKRSTTSFSYTTNQRSNSSTSSLDNTPCNSVSLNKDASQASDMQRQPHDQSHDKDERSQDQFGERVGPVSRSLSRKSKTSGLRMPSPKIGFFDPANSSNLDDGSANRTKNTKLQPARASPEPCYNKGENSKKIGALTPTLETRPIRSAKSHVSPILGRERILGFSSKTAERNCVKNLKSRMAKDRTKPRKRDTKGSIDYSLGNDDEKENFGDLVDGLSRTFQTIDLSGDLVIELKRKKSTSQSLVEGHFHKTSAKPSPVSRSPVLNLHPV